MTDLSSMLRTHPRQPKELAAIERAIAACFSCVQACLTCADACLSEQDPRHLADCIRFDLDCADICKATGSVLLRLGRHDAQPLQAQLAACAQACRTCAEECRRHAMHQHCRLCAEACQACHDACEDMMIAMRHAGESHADQK